LVAYNRSRIGFVVVTYSGLGYQLIWTFLASNW